MVSSLVQNINIKTIGCKCLIDFPKEALSSQTEKIMLTTTFSHFLGLKHCKKPNFENFLTYFQPVQAIQSFTT